jgi:hypothetical protein
MTPRATTTQSANGTPRRRQRGCPRLAVGARVLAKMLDVGLRSVRSLDASGKLPAGIRLGTRKVWVVAEIKAWLRCGAPDRATWENLKAGPP